MSKANLIPPTHNRGPVVEVDLSMALARLLTGIAERYADRPDGEESLSEVLTRLGDATRNEQYANACGARASHWQRARIYAMNELLGDERHILELYPPQAREFAAVLNVAAGQADGSAAADVEQVESELLQAALGGAA